jgi:hypothetical protein
MGTSETRRTSGDVRPGPYRAPGEKNLGAAFSISRVRDSTNAKKNYRSSSIVKGEPEGSRKYRISSAAARFGGAFSCLERSKKPGDAAVFAHLHDWFDEFRLYHRKDGKVVKEYDDLLCASRYALMMLRFARTVQERSRFGRDLHYPKQAFY